MANRGPVIAAFVCLFADSRKLDCWLRLPSSSNTHHPGYIWRCNGPCVSAQTLLAASVCIRLPVSQTFTLGQQRAIAAALNTLVFRTQLPDVSSGGSGGTAKRGASLGRDYEMLQHSAPLLHRWDDAPTICGLLPAFQETATAVRLAVFLFHMRQSRRVQTWHHCKQRCRLLSVLVLAVQGAL